MVSQANSQNIVGAFIDAKTACAGLSSAMNILCRKAGIPSIKVHGKLPSTPGDTGHAWNIVKADGHAFNLDCTTGILNEPNVPAPSFLGLSMTDETVGQAGYARSLHEFSYPTCCWHEGEAWEGAEYPYYDFDACLWKCFADVERGKLDTVMRFSDAASLNAFASDFMKENAIDTIMSKAGLPSLNVRYVTVPPLRAISLRWSRPPVAKAA